MLKYKRDCSCGKKHKKKKGYMSGGKVSYGKVRGTGCAKKGKRGAKES